MAEIYIGGYVLPNLQGYKTSMFNNNVRKSRPDLKRCKSVGLVFTRANGQKGVHWISSKEITEKEFETLPKIVEA